MKSNDNILLVFCFLKKVLCFVFLLSFEQFLFSDTSQLKIKENSFFEIVGTDLGSTQFTNELSSYVAKSILSDLYKKDYVPTQRILVQLLNTDSTFNDNDFYELSISHLGNVTLNIKWNESLDLPTLIEALTVSFIQSFGYSNYGELYLGKYPSKAWLLKGLSKSIYVSLRPNVARLFYKEAISLAFEFGCLNAKFLSNSAPSDAQSFAFYQYIKSNRISREDRLIIFKNTLLGRDSLPAIYRSFDLDSYEAIQNNLSDFLKSQYQINIPRFESLSVSKKWLEGVGDFSSIEIQSIQAKRNSLHLLWMNRNDPLVIQLIEARIRLLLYSLSKINPLYYNAAQSLALTYQKIIDGVEEWELLYYFSDFMVELDKANTVSLQINKQLQRP